MPDYLERMIQSYLTMPKDVVLRDLSLDEAGRYWIVSNGNLLSVCREQPYFKQFRDNGEGYYYTEICGKKYYLHRLLAFSFNQDQEKKKIIECCEVHHLDRNKQNNNLNNLCILTREKHKAIHRLWDKLDKWEVIPWEKLEID